MKFIETIKFIKKQFDTNKFIPLHEPVFFGNEKNIYQKLLIQPLFLQLENMLIGSKKNLLCIINLIML